MKIELNLTKKRFFVLVGVILVLIGVFGVYAYNSVYGNPAVMGHSADELEVNWDNIDGIPSGFADGVDNDTIAHVSGGLYGYCCSVGTYGGVCPYTTTTEPAYYSSGCKCRDGYTGVNTGVSPGDPYSEPQYMYSCLKD